MSQPPKIMHLDDFDHVPGPGSLTWLPVRQTLGIEAFGTNAYIAAEPGEDVVESHTEVGEGEDPTSGHQELYFVARGRATFTIDGTEHDAPAGTYVFIADPTAHRHAIAEEAGTTVLSFGGPATFRPSGWEWAFRALPLLRDDPDRARALLDEGLEHDPGSENLLYNLACLEALQGNREEAFSLLERVLADRPKLRRWASEDEDLASLRDDERFTALTAEG